MKLFRKMGKYLGRLVLIMVLLMALLVAAGYAGLKLYGDSLKEFTVAQINKRVETRISAGSIDLSLLKGFPYLSIVLRDVSAMSSGSFEPASFKGSFADTLFSSDYVYLKFSIPDVLMGKYRIRRIQAANGRIHLLTDPYGDINYRFIKARDKQEEASDFALDLQMVRLSEFGFIFENQVQQIIASGRIKDLSLKGKFATNSYSLGAVAGLQLDTFSREGIIYFRETSLDARLVADMNDNKAEIRKGELKFSNFSASVKGSVGFGEPVMMGLDIRTRNVDLRSVMQSMPVLQRFNKSLNIYGRGSMALQITGPASAREMPELKGAYMLDINRIDYDTLSISNIQLRGNYTNGKLRSPGTSRISVESFRIRDRASDLNGSLVVQSFLRPQLRLDLKGQLDAGILNEFADYGFKGSLEPELRLETRLESLDDLKGKAFVSGSLSGQTGLKDFSFRLKGYETFREVNGLVKFDGDSWYPELSFVWGESNGRLFARLDHVLAHFLGKTQGLYVSGKLEAGKFSLDPFLVKDETQDNPVTFTLPAGIQILMDFSADSLTAGKFTAGELYGKLFYQTGHLNLESLEMNTLGGKLKGNSALHQEGDKSLRFRTTNRIDGIDIKKLFAAFNNFNQEFITDRHLAGRISGNIDFAVKADSLLKIDQSSLTAQAEVDILDGELNNFEPAKGLSKFIALEELENIRFSRLQNTILIKDRRVTIPEMEINSSAFNLFASGFHTFDNYFEYKVRLNLSEFLAGKAKGSKKENTEYLVEETGTRRSSLYLSITGTPDDFKVRYDRKEAIQHIRQDLKNEKTTLKNILNEEFGWFGKDTLNIKQIDKKPEQKFIFEWGEEVDSLKTTSPKKTRPRDKKEEKIRFEWDDK